MKSFQRNDMNFDLADSLWHADRETGILYWKVQSQRRKMGDIAGHIQKHGYVRVHYDIVGFYVHRINWMLWNKEWPSAQIEHKNRHKHDNRQSNLRCSSQRENTLNLTLRKDNTSGITGVSWHEKGKTWQVCIMSTNSKRFVYYATNRDIAIRLRRILEIRHGYYKMNDTSPAVLYVKNRNTEVT